MLGHQRGARCAAANVRHVQKVVELHDLQRATDGQFSHGAGRSARTRAAEDWDAPGQTACRHGAAERRSGGAQDARTTQRCQRLVSTKGSTQKQAGEALTMFAPVSGARRRPERCVCPRGGCPGGVPKSSSKRQKGPAIGPRWTQKFASDTVVNPLGKSRDFAFSDNRWPEGKPEKLR